jgi:periplasmic divalent cation tolerance protein
MIIKTTRDVYPALEAWLLEAHPYDVPEAIALPLEAGSRSYLDWIAAECGEQKQAWLNK